MKFILTYLKFKKVGMMFKKLLIHFLCINIIGCGSHISLIELNESPQTLERQFDELNKDFKGKEVKVELVNGKKIELYDPYIQGDKLTGVIIPEDREQFQDVGLEDLQYNLLMYSIVHTESESLILIPIDSIIKMRGKKSEFIKWIGAGILVGGIIGAVIGANQFQYMGPRLYGPSDEYAAAAIGGIIGVASGALIGYVIGNVYKSDMVYDFSQFSYERK